ncbi:MAG: DEAD/DEAH box helicase, partial [Rikenellaceae bacterium]
MESPYSKNRKTIVGGSEELKSLFVDSKAVRNLLTSLKSSKTIHLRGLVKSALPLYASATFDTLRGVHIFVAEDRDSAAYLLNDLYELAGEESVHFLPSSYKRSILYGNEDANGVVQRTATLNAIRHSRNSVKSELCVVCTYPESIAERVVDNDAMQRQMLTIKVGERISSATIVELLEESLFTRVDFVYEPGQYSIRGGIIDIFSYSQSEPYRIDMFGSEVDSIRQFSISTQLSTAKLEMIEIIPNLNKIERGVESSISLIEFAGEEATIWFDDADYALKKVNELRRKLVSDLEEPSTIDSYVTSRKQLLSHMEGNRVVLIRDNLSERNISEVLEFNEAPQPSFNKNFEVLAADIIAMEQRGYRCFILSRNKAQIERLESIFHQLDYKNLRFNALNITLHEGLIDHDLKLCLYTDHQIFDRYQRYKIKGEIKRDEQMTIAELNQLRVGDYVVHYDHGVGRFAGLVKINEGGRLHEAIKLIYKDNDVLFVNVHSLHRISRYKSGEGESVKSNKLGSGAWVKVKNAAKKALKDISRELITLYAKRKASEGFAFSPDGYMQQELEASFMYEDTPDQSAATEAVKRDMESERPMDRLVCGDVGFGKTEVAIRAAFKAATDGKQCAVLVPTTILAMQHYRSFNSRLKGLPVRVEYLNRTKSTKEVNQILHDLSEGRVDILIGTHKILNKSISFKDLGLLIIDEEQK